VNQTIKKRVRDSTPTSLRNFRRLVIGLINLSRADKHKCNLCGYEGRFWPFGNPPRRGATCGGCGSQERHRLIGLWLAANPELVEGAKILHFAPEATLVHSLSAYSSCYRTADLDPNVADTVLDIEQIDLPSDSVDVVVCSHVLEHVDDAKALREIRRILTRGGRALLMFPIVEGWDRSYENEDITSPADRAKHFGQDDHVRMFGRDVRQRITDASLDLTEFTAEEPDVSQYGLTRGEKVFVAVKP